MKILKYIRANSKVLDVGCSSGYLSKEFKKKGCYVVGVEISKVAAEVAKQYCDEVLIGDLEEMHLSFPLGFFDFIVCADVLEHLKRPDLVLTKLESFLAPTGLIIASLPNVAQVRVRLKLLLGKFEYGDSGILDLTHLRFFTLDTAKQLFTESGYEVLKVDYTGLASKLKILRKWLAFQFIIVAKPRSNQKGSWKPKRIFGSNIPRREIHTKGELSHHQSRKFQLLRKIKETL